jgi:hypothetical protein
MSAEAVRLNTRGRRIHPGRGDGFSHFDPIEVKFAVRFVRGDEAECWPWLGAVAKSGYGTLGHRYAHRLAWEFANGEPITDGMTVDHLCWNTICVNPRHLRLVTRVVNASRQRPYRKTHCKHGHDLGDPTNLYFYGHRRFCRACHLRRTAVRYKRKKAGV